ncbi:MAG: hypothetical protein Q9159_006104 [Coniocarpon cinnabarinum]
MKVQALTRSSESFQPAGSSLQRLPRNLSTSHHPFERAREYTRALNATKLNRLFAQPFLGQLGHGHVDGVYTLASDPNSLERLASGDGSGVVKVWDVTNREEVWQAKPHIAIVKSVCWTLDRKLLSAGSVDKSVALHDPYNSPSKSEPLSQYHGKTPFTGLSHHRDEPAFAASTATGIHIYDLNRPGATPTQTLQWPTSVDTLTTVSFNPVETSILASAATDRSIVLYDLRTNSPLTKTTLSLSTNAISWNPMEAFNFAAASEDHNVYIFDSRNMKRALNVLKDHVAAVMDVRFSPTGEDLVTASYDRTVRLWSRSRGHSKDIYHTKRMQRVFSALYTQDTNYILSGSDDGNIRLWRADASKRAGPKSARQRQSLEYSEALRRRYGHMPEVRRIERHRHVPKVVKKAGEIKKEEVSSMKRREENRRRHESKTAGSKKRKGEREGMVVGTEE